MIVSTQGHCGHGVDSVQIRNILGGCALCVAVGLATSRGEAQTLPAQTPGSTPSSSYVGTASLPGELPSALQTGSVLTFDAEFNAANDLSQFNLIQNASPYNNELEYYVPSAVAVQNGMATLTATPKSGLPNGLTYESGKITTQGLFAQTYGIFEMRAELPAGAGMWPAFWLLPNDGSFPPEIDIMEQLGRDPTTTYSSIHWLNPGSSVLQTQTTAVDDLDTTGEFHTYAVDWEPDFTTYYVDGQAIARYATPPSVDMPMYVIANLAVGGAWPGQPAGETGQMDIDYIRVYERVDVPEPASAALILAGLGGVAMTRRAAARAKPLLSAPPPC
jgi:beta-glucanase (GH16 family)